MLLINVIENEIAVISLFGIRILRRNLPNVKPFVKFMTMQFVHFEQRLLKLSFPSFTYV